MWYTKDYRTRESSESTASKAPAGLVAWLGWASGLAGLCLYSKSTFPLTRSVMEELIDGDACADVPRWRQIYKIRKSGSMENISPWMFAWLLLQNVTMLIVSTRLQLSTSSELKGSHRAEHPCSLSRAAGRVRAGPLHRKRLSGAAGRYLRMSRWNTGGGPRRRTNHPTMV